MAMPDEVQDVFGYALHLAQSGSKHDQAKPLRGQGSAAVLEAVEDWKGDTYRAVYTVKFSAAVCRKSRRRRSPACRSPSCRACCAASSGA
jgi:phage-related protein